MKIIDMHIHAFNTEINPDALIEKMENIGIYGGCVFSNWPILNNKELGTTFDERLKEVLAWCKGYEDRLFPIMWIHPYEEDIIENIHKAVDMGICGFKMICSNYYVYEDKCIEVLKEIAKLDKPVFFHSGILWDAQVSSSYNRPINWESLLDIEGLRFSMGHCSWPWVDECISMYGKFLEAGNNKNTAEMFFDITPGTPPIYRKDLLNKLFNTGYDTGDNIMYGSDSSADKYTADFITDCLDRDCSIMDELGVSEEIREKIYYKNLLRFLGKTETKIEHFKPEPDKVDLWNCENKEVYKIIENYYKKLNFPEEYNYEFYRALKEIKISDSISIDRYNLEEKDGKRNFLSYLYMCDKLKKKYEEKNIPEEIFNDTVKDLVVWANTWTDLKGELYLGEIDWLSNHLKMKLFKLGRLQFCMGKSEYDIPEKNLKKGDNVIEVHIPEGEPLNNEKCKESINMAKKFFEEYFPEFKYNHFICNSWLMDDTLKELLSPESNMIKFMSMFQKFHKKKDDAILRYVFKWNTTRMNLRNAVVTSSFADKVQKHILGGKDFYSAYGVMDK